MHKQKQWIIYKEMFKYPQGTKRKGIPNPVRGACAKRTHWRRLHSLQALCFGIEPAQVEEGAVQTITNVDTFLQVMESVGQHAGEEDIQQDRG